MPSEFRAAAAVPGMRQLPPALRYILHAEAPARAAAQGVWGVAFAAAPCRAVANATRATLWLGPDEYLLLDFAGESALAVGNDLELAMGALPHALVDVSHRQLGFEISGEHAAEILNGACPLDLDISAFPIDMCTRTVLAKADIVLWRRSMQVFHLEVWRSFGDYAIALLAEIARSSQ